MAGPGTFTMGGNTQIYGNSATGTNSYGGGVSVGSSGSRFQMAGGVVYGSNAQTGVRNTAASGNGAALFIATGGPANFGTANGGTFTPGAALVTTSDTIRAP